MLSTCNRTTQNQHRGVHVKLSKFYFINNIMICQIRNEIFGHYTLLILASWRVLSTLMQIKSLQCVTCPWNVKDKNWILAVTCIAG